MSSHDLSLALRKAIAKRRPAELRQLLEKRGLVAFTQRLLRWPPRVIMDALTLLPVERKGAVLRHLPSRRRDQLDQLERPWMPSLGLLTSGSFVATVTDAFQPALH